MGELKEGEQLLLVNGDEAEVISLTIEQAKSKAFTTYNFEVADWHTYFVAPIKTDLDGACVWVHNAGGDECVKLAPGNAPGYDKKQGQGLYVLEDAKGNVKYVGIGDTAARGASHATDPLRAGLKQRVLFDTGTLTKAQARGLEAKLMGKLGGPQSANPNTTLLNKIRSFGANNPNRSNYRKAVTKDLWKDTLKRLKDSN